MRAEKQTRKTPCSESHILIMPIRIMNIISIIKTAYICCCYSSPHIGTKEWILHCHAESKAYRKLYSYSLHTFQSHQLSLTARYANIIRTETAHTVINYSVLKHEKCDYNSPETEIITGKHAN